MFAIFSSTSGRPPTSQKVSGQFRTVHVSTCIYLAWCIELEGDAQVAMYGRGCSDVTKLRGGAWKSGTLLVFVCARAFDHNQEGIWCLFPR